MRISIQPPAELRDFVQEIAVLKNTAAGVSLEIPCYADGSPGIVVYSSDESIFASNPARKLSRFFLYGQTIQPISLLASGEFSMEIFHLHPHAVFALFGIRACELADSCIDLSLLGDANIKDTFARLGDTHCSDDRIRLVWTCLNKLVETRSAKPDALIYSAINAVVDSRGTRSIQQIRAALQISPRTFERRFLEHVGVTPKLFSRIVKFQSALRMIGRGDFQKLSDVAYELEYTDQSHLVRAFREFTGVSPKRFKPGYVIPDPELV